MRRLMMLALVILFPAGGVLAQSQASSQAQAETSAKADAKVGKSNAQVNAQNSTSASAHAQSNNQKQKKEENAGATASGSSNTAAAAQAGHSSAELSSGSVIEAALTKSLDAGKCKEGDPVVARVTQDVKSNGRTVIPKGSRLVGHVTQAKPHAKGESASALGIVFDHAQLRNGREVPVHAVIQAVAAAQSAASASMMDDQAALSGTGAGAAQTHVQRPSGNSGGGLLGGATSTVGSTVNGATSAVGSVGQTAGATVGGTVNSATSATTGAGGHSLTSALSSTSTGVIGLKDLSLTSEASNATQGSVITSPNRNVHLDSGTQLLLRAVGEAPKK